MSLTGPGPGQPTQIGVPIGDLLAGMYGAYGAVAALCERERTGRGRIVRTSLLAAIVGVHAFQGTRYTVAGKVPHAEGNHHPSLAPDGAFRCKDAIVQVAVGSEGLWRKFAPLVEIEPDDPLFADNAHRVRHRRPSSSWSTVRSPNARWTTYWPNSTKQGYRPARSAHSTGAPTGSPSCSAGGSPSIQTLPRSGPRISLANVDVWKAPTMATPRTADGINSAEPTTARLHG